MLLLVVVVVVVVVVDGDEREWSTIEWPGHIPRQVCGGLWK